MARENGPFAGTPEHHASVAGYGRQAPAGEDDEIGMPFRSEKQERFMWARHPDVAREWADKYGSLLGRMAQKHKAKRSGGDDGDESGRD